jgi:arylsulfatase A-like enzyme
MLSRRDVLRQMAVSGTALACGAQAVGGQKKDRRPNIIFILADDLGYSDIGPYGSEIETPNLDRLAKGGVRFSQFYNSPRCCPSRAALLTGMYSHQAQMGDMVADYGRYAAPAYHGDLSEQCVTMAEALHGGGYATMMVGKWHLTPIKMESKHNWPMQRGFDKYFGIINGAAEYYDPLSLTEGNETLPNNHGAYLTDRFADKAVEYVGEAGAGDKPFFLYLAFNAPHWPIQAPEETAVEAGFLQGLGDAAYGGLCRDDRSHGPGHRQGAGEAGCDGNHGQHADLLSVR